ncbi:UNVERIFIED_CONTAM: hypothetical protein Sradi_0734900 [Sesamum radiatum]|uniref:Uncharacterized protein n=1 Tax=Sesamum radiatum TaxID=300843 RepID=A0AAW2VNH4_SESRA
MSLEDIVKSLAVTTQQFQQKAEAGLQETKAGLQETRAGLQETNTCLNHLGTQISQLATSFNQLAAQVSGKLPSQTEANPRENVSAMTLRSGKELQPAESMPMEKRKFMMTPSHTLTRRRACKRNFGTFKKVEINIPLLDAIKQIPKYAKFLKELCTNKRKLKDKERIIFGKNVSAVINHTNVIIQLADRSYVRPMGLVEDVLIKVNDLLFPVDFYILKMGTEELDNSASVLLGRPFMKTAKTKIDVDEVIHDVLEEELVGTELNLIMDLDDDDECVEFIGEVLAPSQSFGTNHTTSQTNSLQSILQAPILKLKALPNHLQSLYLGVRETSSASIFKELLKNKMNSSYMKEKSGEVAKRKQKAKLRNLDKGNSFPYDEVGNLDDAALTSPPQSTHG